MRALVLLTAFLFSFFPAAAGMAAEVYVQKNSGKIDVQPEEDLPAPPQNIKDFANQYYKTCLSKQHPIIQGENLQMLCACTAAKIPGIMTVDQMKLLQTDTKEGQHQRNRMLMFVYTPCIEYPAKALVQDSCMENEQVRLHMSHYKKVCDCLADNMGRFISAQAPKTIEAALRRDPQDIDPLALLVNSEAFDLQSKIQTKKCVLRYQFGMLE